MFDFLSSGEFIVGCFLVGMLFRFGCNFADFILDGYKHLFRALNLHFQGKRTAPPKERRS